MPTIRLPDVGLSGVNDPACRSAAPPVVLLHGTFSTPASNFRPMAAGLQAAGRCVYAVLYGARFGWGGIGAVDTSADQVTTFIDQVRAATDADAVDVVAFSQGALVLRDALQNRLNPSGIGLAVFVAPNYHGTTVPLVSKVPAAVCPACTDQAVGSMLLRRLAAVGELSGTFRYATLSSRQDQWVLPVDGQPPMGPADRVRAQILEDSCPTVVSQHSDLPAQPAVINWTLAALNSAGRPPATFSCA